MEQQNQQNQPKQLRPIRNHIIFKFKEDTWKRGLFVRKTASGILLPGGDDDITKTPRWAVIHAVGPECTEELKVEGCEILITPMMWTNSFKFNEEKLWRTDETKVMGYRYPEDKLDENGNEIPDPPMFYVDNIWEKPRRS